MILLDVMMPGMNGYEVCRALKSDPQLDHIPLIFLTAKASTDMKVEGLETGADDYVAKPFSVAQLVLRAQAGAQCICSRGHRFRWSRGGRVLG